MDTSLIPANPTTTSKKPMAGSKKVKVVAENDFNQRQNRAQQQQVLSLRATRKLHQEESAKEGAISRRSSTKPKNKKGEEQDEEGHRNIARQDKKKKPSSSSSSLPLSSVLALINPCCRRVMLTGYPLQNNLQEYYTMLFLLEPTYITHAIGSLETFTTEFQGAMDRLQASVIAMSDSCGGGGGAATPDTNLELAAFRRSRLFLYHVSPLVLRRGPEILRKILPDRHMYTVFVRPNNAQVAAYNSLLKKELDSRGGGMFKVQVDAARLLCVGENFGKQNKKSGSTVEGGGQNSNSKDNNFYITPKLEVLLSIVQTSLQQNHLRHQLMSLTGSDLFAAGSLPSIPVPEPFVDKGKKEKVVIFALYYETLTAVEELLQHEIRQGRLQTKFVRVDGSMAPVKRVELCKQFCDDQSNVDVLVLSLKAGCEGLNLYAASVIISLDLWWNPALEEEAFGRTWRLGQKKLCEVFVLATLGTLEEAQLRLKYGKEFLSKALVDGSWQSRYLAKTLQASDSSSSSSCKVGRSSARQLVEVVPRGDETGVSSSDDGGVDDESGTDCGEAVEEDVSAGKKSEINPGDIATLQKQRLKKKRLKLKPLPSHCSKENCLGLLPTAISDVRPCSLLSQVLEEVPHCIASIEDRSVGSVVTSGNPASSGRFSEVDGCYYFFDENGEDDDENSTSRTLPTKAEAERAQQDLIWERMTADTAPNKEEEKRPVDQDALAAYHSNSKIETKWTTTTTAAGGFGDDQGTGSYFPALDEGNIGGREGTTADPEAAEMGFLEDFELDDL